ncbi:MAG: biopolymer transporter ExbD [Candidatus Omnitrophica bacterium]|nr:biopolymer transporter ExbD [Candidatus Omnitrophota bacterium]
MIKIKGQKDYMVALESVAMTDIILNMFIFFFISFSLLYTLNPLKISNIDIKLPKASSATALKGEGRAVIAVTKDGAFFIDDKKIAAAGLKAALKQRLKEDPSMGLLLKVDGLAKFDNVAYALDVINALHIQKVSVAVIKKTTK